MNWNLCNCRITVAIISKHCRGSSSYQKLLSNLQCESTYQLVVGKIWCCVVCAKDERDYCIFCIISHTSIEQKTYISCFGALVAFYYLLCLFYKITQGTLITTISDCYRLIPFLGCRLIGIAESVEFLIHPVAVKLSYPSTIHIALSAHSMGDFNMCEELM